MQDGQGTFEDNTSNWAKVWADILEDCFEDLSFSLENTARNSQKVLHKSNIYSQDNIVSASALFKYWQRNKLLQGINMVHIEREKSERLKVIITNCWSKQLAHPHSHSLFFFFEIMLEYFEFCQTLSYTYFQYCPANKCCFCGKLFGCSWQCFLVQN